MVSRTAPHARDMRNSGPYKVTINSGLYRLGFGETSKRLPVLGRKIQELHARQEIFGGALHADHPSLYDEDAAGKQELHEIRRP